MLQRIMTAWGWAHDLDNEISFTGTINLNQQYPYALAQVALTLTMCSTSGPPSWCQVYLTGFSADGNPVPLLDAPNFQGIHNADSFSFEGDVLFGTMKALITVYCFE